MKKRVSIFLLTILVVAGFSSCDKYHAKKLSGSYTCSVHYHYMDITPMEMDSTYTEILEVEQDGKNIKVLGYTIPIDSVWKTDGYTVGSYNQNFTVRFDKDKIYCYTYSGGLGGHATREYNGSR